MTNKPNNITDMPYAKWMEQTLHDIFEMPMKGILVAGVLENGDTYTNYYSISMADKLLLAGLINQDATLDMMAANGIIKYEEDDENEEEETYGEEEE